MILFAVLLAAAGCGGYGEVGETTYDYAQAIYSISNRQAANKIEQVARQLEAACRDGELNEREARWLDEMLDDCRSGRWQQANQAARRMMQDQIDWNP